MNEINRILQNVTEYQELSEALTAHQVPAAVFGLSAIHKAHYIYSLCKDEGRKALVITDDESSAKRLCEDINAMAEKECALLYPARDLTFHEVESVSREYEHIRLSVLSKIINGDYTIVIASADAALSYTLPRDELKARTVTLSSKNAVSLAELTACLYKAGYVKRPQVDGVCQFSVRGGIVDFYPSHMALPVRAEYWGDDIDSLSCFDLDTQRRMDTIKEVKITPAYEVLFSSDEDLTGKLNKLLLKQKKGGLGEKMLKTDLEKLFSGLEIVAKDKYLPIAYQAPETLFDYMSDDLIFVSEYYSVKEDYKNFHTRFSEDLKMLFEDGILCKGLDLYYADNIEYIHNLQNGNTVFLEAFARSINEVKLQTQINANAVALSVWSGDYKLLLEDIQSLLFRKQACIVLAGTKRAATALVNDLQKDGIPADFSGSLKHVIFGKVLVSEGFLSSGFEYPEIKVTLITQGRTVNAAKRKPRHKQAGEQIKSLSDLNVGDFVVHVSHGIGIFEGIHKLDVHGIVKDYIKIRYAGADTLYVPVTQLDLVSKYIGPREDSAVKLNKLNSTEWQKTRQRVKKAVADMAKELIQIYSKRMQSKGFAFSEDNEWQKEFEERFPFEETQDQLRCIEEIKQDMMAQVPMDRLLCGDVGFGKTEVALRGAFKCVMDSKQCGLLVPTTILAWQHYQTIIKRVQGFPITVELLSRFRTPKEQEKILKRLKTGEIDILIGTHRLIQKDVKFKNLGLVIIDEEQRFGVAHKEKFKELFADIDIVTLSATPIPRTLNMAMSGIRDMSVIEQAPMDRYPVQTYVIEHEWGVITDAMKRELRRGGQVFYLHNRVETIESCCSKIQALLPDARVTFAHGKMSEDELSKVWQSLMDHDIDILVSTTIIETGVDVSNCNTLVIEDADRLGLSQLYQLRGRVGRSNRRAFAYMTVKRGKALTEVATKRLEAIREFTAFGSGFKIAMRDLEIRGAGNILGSQQHGHMEAVGYDMYLKLLSEAILEEKGEPPVRKAEECLVDIRMQAHIPEKYIDNLSQRIDVYKKIASIQNENDALDVTDELIDRFGDPPASVLGLIDVALVRNMAGLAGIKEITQNADAVIFYPEKMNMEKASGLAATLKGRVMVNVSAKPYIAVKIAKSESALDTIRLAVSQLL